MGDMLDELSATFGISMSVLSLPACGGGGSGGGGGGGEEGGGAAGGESLPQPRNLRAGLRELFGTPWFQL